MGALDRPTHVSEDAADVLGTDDHRGRAGERLGTPLRQLVVATHRVFQLRPMRGHRVARAGRRSHRTAEDHMTHDHQIGGQTLADGSSIRGHPGVQLRATRGLHQLNPVAVVLIEHEDGKQPVDIRADGGGATEVVKLRMRLLREDGHVVSPHPPLARQLASENIRAGTREQVPMPKEDPHHRTSKPIASTN